MAAVTKKCYSNAQKFILPSYFISIIGDVPFGPENPNVWIGIEYVIDPIQNITNVQIVQCDFTHWQKCLNTIEKYILV